MRAFAIDAPGQLGSLHDLPRPELGDRDILVRVRVAGVNPVDWKKADAVPAGHSFPMVLG